MPRVGGGGGEGGREIRWSKMLKMGGFEGCFLLTSCYTTWCV